MALGARDLSSRRRRGATATAACGQPLASLYSSFFLSTCYSLDYLWDLSLTLSIQAEVLVLRAPVAALVTQPILQHRTNPTELRSMDSYIHFM